jgi:gas vesicle protein
MNSGKVVLGVLAGIAAGAIVGILVAPDKGAKTRKKLLNKGDEYIDDLHEKFDDFLETVTQKFERKYKEVEDMVAKGRARYEDAKREVKNGMS